MARCYLGAYEEPHKESHEPSQELLVEQGEEDVVSLFARTVESPDRGEGRAKRGIRW